MAPLSLAEHMCAALPHATMPHLPRRFSYPAARGGAWTYRIDALNLAHVAQVPAHIFLGEPSLTWIRGSLTFFPQGLVPLIFLITGAPVKSWFLALYMPHAPSWVTVLVMITVGAVLYAQAIQITVRGGQRARATTATASEPAPARSGRKLESV